MPEYRILRQKSTGRNFRVVKVTMDVPGFKKYTDWGMVPVNYITHSPIERWEGSNSMLIVEDIDFPFGMETCKTARQVENCLLARTEIWELSGAGQY